VSVHRRTFLIGIAIAACGGGSKQTRGGTADAPDDHKSERTIDQWTTEDENQAIQLACQHMVEPDGAFRCPILTKVGLDPNSCIASFNSLRAAAVADQQSAPFRRIIAGVSGARTCDEVDVVLQVVAREIQANTSAQHNATASADCKRRPDGSIDLDDEGVLRRRGLGDRVFGDTASTPESPIEVCGVRAELVWLTRLTCADGSRPWGKDLDKAHASRLGSQPAKSRCGGTVMIDHYRVPCPEKQYDVYMDLYECGPGESVFPD